jgi:glycosyltransferase involved in cell wall biosynthesis
MAGTTRNICIFAKAMNAHRGGKFKWPFSIVAQELAALGHAVTVITTAHPDGKTEREDEAGVPVHYLRGTKPEKPDAVFWQKSAALFDRLHKDRPFDIVMGRGTSPLGFSRMSRFARALPVILHEGTYPDWLQGYEIRPRIGGTSRRRLHARLHAATHRDLTESMLGASLIVCNSPALARGLKQAYWWSDVKTACIPYGFDTSFVRQETGELPAALNELSRSGRRYLVYLGRITRAKGAFDLPEIAAASKHRDFAIVAMGGASDETLAKLRATAQAKGVGERLILPGPVAHSALPKVLANAEALLFPSVHPESLPKAAMEAMACGLPVLAYRLPAFEGLVDDAVEGFLVPAGASGELAAALDRLLDDPALARRMGEAAARRIETEFSPATAAHLWQEALDKVIAEFSS